MDCAPGRIDAGLGRANGSPAVDRALGTDRRVENPDKDHAEKITAVINHLYETYPDEHAYSEVEIPCSSKERPRPWTLGSSPSSAALAAELGVPYCFAAFIRPQFATRAFEEYHTQFQPSQQAGRIAEPQGMVAVNAVCAETDEKAARLRASAEASFKRMQRGSLGLFRRSKRVSKNLDMSPSQRQQRLIPTNGPEQSRGARKRSLVYLSNSQTEWVSRKS